jgi:AsmA-like C-terminal region
MRILRLAAIVVLVLALLAGIAAALLMANQDRVIRVVLDAVRQRTGLVIEPRAGHLQLADHLVVELDQPTVLSGGQELLKLAKIRAVVNYHSIVFAAGTPLHALILEHPDVTLRTTPESLRAMPLPPPGTQAVNAVVDVLANLRRVAWRFEARELTVRDPGGKPLVSRASIVAFRSHFHPGLWIGSFNCIAASPPFAGMHVAGNLRVGHGRKSPPHEFSHGRVWFWDAPLETVGGAHWHASGRSQGSVQFSIRDDGAVSGEGDFGVNQLALSGSDLTVPLQLGEYSLHAKFAASTNVMTIGQATLRRGEKVAASGSAEIKDPFGVNPEVTAHLAQIAIDVPAVKAHLRALRRMPAYVTGLLARISSGTLVIGEADLATSYKQLRDNPIEAMRKDLGLVASIGGAGFTLPDDYKLPPVSAMSAQLHYADKVLTANQGTAQLGNSPVGSISVRVDFSKGFKRVPYELSFKADTDIGELLPAARLAMVQLDLKGREQIEGASGRLLITANASGVFTYDRLEMPPRYLCAIEANRFQIRAKGTPGPVQFTRGKITIEPNLMRIDHLALATTGGDGLIDGDLRLESRSLRVSRLSVEMHRMPAGLWLPLVIDPSDIQLDGPVGGKITVRGDPKNPSEFLADGKMVVATGDLGFGFLRAPIKFEGATLTFAGHGMTLALPSAQLEGEPLNFKLSVANLQKPLLRIDAISQAMDLQVMRFIRLPWEPTGPPPTFRIPVEGHIEVRKGRLSALAMSNVKTDFVRNDGAWRVYNFTGDTLKGKFALDLVGRPQDEWIQIKGHMAGIQLTQLFLLSGKVREAPMRGKMWVAADLWADVGPRFFDTLSGTAAITMRDGKIERMTLLSRLLALIDLKSWLTVQIPDPTVTGLPFDTALGDFKGEGGNFFTDNFVLNGPVMDITATGSVRVGTGELDMNVGMFPFQTVNWLINKIPLIGGNVAGGTGNLLAAYFEVSGPVTDPSIRPKPITSVAEFVKKTLGLPINLLRPNTIK